MLNAAFYSEAGGFTKITESESRKELWGSLRSTALSTLGLALLYLPLPTSLTLPSLRRASKRS